jgi:RNA ligase (TIGR02306 family)
MSSFVVEIVTVDVEEHPNADRLDVLKIRGQAWQCVSAKDNFKTGDMAVYLPIDSVLPETLVTQLGIANYYSKRLRTVKLRGQISQGMVAPLSILTANADPSAETPRMVGDDVTAELGITKYDPPIPVEMSGKVRPHDGRFVKYTDIENFKRYPDVFKDGEMVVITEKIHGTNGRAANIEGEIHVGSHNLNLIEAEGNLYWRGATLLDVKNKLKPGEQIFFEVYGHKVQDLGYGKKPGEISVGVFDFMVDGKYLGDGDLGKLLNERGWQDFAVPVLHRGEWSKDLIATHSDGPSTLSDDTVREGFVVKPAVETVSEALGGGRKIIKVISDAYLLRKDGTERH